jgi:tetratricopeptide (TPR) repeat protein
MKPRTILGLTLLLIATISLIAYLFSLIIPSAFPEQVNNQIYLIIAIIVGVAAFLAALNDITELISKLTARSSLDKKPPPTPTQTSPTAQVVDISNVKSSEINVNIGDITRADRIIGTLFVGDQYKAQTIIFQKEGKETRVPLQLPPRPEHGLRGRETELQKLLDDLQPGKIVTLCGPGGIGKTALASEAIWRLTDNGTKHPDFFPDGVLFHSFYNQPEAALALEQIALTFGEDPRPTPEAAARRALSNRCTLIILDGAETADNLDKLVDIRNRNTVLITSRNIAHLIDIGQDLSPLDLESSVTLLKDWGGDQVTSDDHAHRICTLVGGLPLAVRLVGRFLAVHKDDIADYASWLEKSPLAALDQGIRRLESVPILLERNLEYISGGARETLAVISLLGFAPFDRNLIYSTLDEEPQLISGWLNELLRFGLLLRDGEFYQVSHVLIRAYARERLHLPDIALSNLSKALMDLMVSIDVDRYPMKCIHFYPHLRVLAQENETSDKKIAALLWTFLGYSLNILANYTTAKESFEQALAIRKEALGEKHPDTASSLNNLGALLFSMGDYSATRLYFEQALAIRKEVLGEKHPDTASSLNSLGTLLSYMGDYSTARPYYEQTLAIRKEVLVEKHPDIASSLNNMGSLLQSMGDLPAARPYYEQALAINQEVLGEEHLGTARNLNSLGFLHKEMGDPIAAQSYFEQTLAIRKEVLGEKHPDTASSLNNLGALLFSMGDYSAARLYYKQALAIRKEVLGEKHPDTASSLTNMGSLLQAMVDLPAARPYFDQALAINQEVLGEEHPDTASILNNLGALLFSMGDYSAARLYFDQALAIRKKVLGEKHPNTGLSLYNLGFLHIAVGDRTAALPYFDQALTIFEKCFPPDHPYIHFVRDSLQSLEDQS